MATEFKIYARDLRLIGKFTDGEVIIIKKGRAVIMASYYKGNMAFCFWQDDMQDNDKNFTVSFSLKDAKELLKKSKKEDDILWSEISSSSIRFQGSSVASAIEIAATEISGKPIIDKLKHALEAYEQEKSAQKPCQIYYIPALGDKKMDLDGYQNSICWQGQGKIYYCGMANVYSSNFMFISNCIKSNLDIDTQVANWF